MFIELVDALRCPRPHEESWLVVSAERLVARHILEGTLGCPVCMAEYAIHDGVVDFSAGARQLVAASVPPSAEQAMRLAAFLGLDDAQGFATLMGAWGAHAIELRGMVDCPIMLIDPPADVDAAPGLSIIRTAGPLPLAAGSTRGLAIDLPDLHGDHAERVASAVRATRAKGRVVGPASLPIPAELHELARDEQHWVAEREAARSPLVTLKRRDQGSD
ncbi:MAG: hypothetical protein JWN79_797 [Gemmatimonadetes bacterium]|nr:hypothetical protein [Gemmatimonadota bacterium]